MPLDAEDISQVSHLIIDRLIDMQYKLLEINDIPYQGCSNASSVPLPAPVAWVWYKLGGTPASGRDHQGLIEGAKFFHDVGHARLGSILQLAMAISTSPKTEFTAIRYSNAAIRSPPPTALEIIF